MSEEMSETDDFERLKATFDILNQLEERIEDNDTQRQLEMARGQVASSSLSVGDANFSQEFERAVGRIASIAVTHGYDELAKKAMEIGGESYG